jgi:CRP-like cAMP-binding protein
MGSVMKPNSRVGYSFSVLFDKATHNVCQRGQILVFPDEEPRGVFYVESGYVKAYTISPEGQCQLVAILGPDEIFPLYWALSQQYEQLYYEAMDTVEFSLLEKDVFKSNVLQDR